MQLVFSELHISYKVLSKHFLENYGLSNIVNVMWQVMCFQHHQVCAPGLTWRQSWMTCVTEAFKETGNCVEVSEAAVTTNTAPSTPHGSVVHLT